jgi:hypothetical protein
MHTSKKRVILKLISFIFLIFGIAAIINTIYRADLAPILWLCYIGMILLGIGVFKNDSILIVSQLNILAIPLIFWNIDFFYGLLNNSVTLFGIVDYYFIPGPLTGKIISSQHLFTIPLSLLALYLIKIKNIDIWKISFFQLIIVFIVTRLITSPVSNVNCVFHPCANFIPESYYLITWFVLGFFLVYLTNYIIIRLRFLRRI